MKPLFLTSLTKAMNAYLNLDPESKQRLHKLQGKIITIEFLPFHFIFQCLFSEHGIDIKTDDLLKADTTIRGTPMQMLGVMITKDNRHRFFADDLKIEGNAELGQQVTELFDELQIDWEEHLSRLVGDVPAHHIGRLIQNIGSWLHNTEQSVTQDTSDYLHEEAAWFPSDVALQDFYDEIDTLRMDVDRIEARIKQGMESLTDHEETQ
jgi:ubiquinone biosynthesis accessory factor UbiJ